MINRKLSVPCKLCIEKEEYILPTVNSVRLCSTRSQYQFFYMDISYEAFDWALEIPGSNGSSYERTNDPR